MHTERMQMSSNIMINIFCSVSCIIVSFGGDDGDPLPPGPCAEPRTHHPTQPPCVSRHTSSSPVPASHRRASASSRRPAAASLDPP